MSIIITRKTLKLNYFFLQMKIFINSIEDTAHFV